MQSRNLHIVFLGLLTVSVFPALALLLFYFFTPDMTEELWRVMESKSNYLFEITLGLLVGLAFGILAWLIIKSKIMRSVLTKYGNLVKSLRLNIVSIIIVSLCAGIGEEFFFRGAVQQFLGIWLTAIIFVAIHGYLSPFDWRITLYGSTMVLFIALLGYMNDALGLVSAMTAHTVFDIVLFYNLTFIPFKFDEDQVLIA